MKIRNNFYILGLCADRFVLEGDLPGPVCSYLSDSYTARNATDLMDLTGLMQFANKLYQAC